MLKPRIRPAIAAVDQDATDLAVTIEVLNPLTVHPEDPFHLRNAHGIPCGPMVRVLDEDLARTPAGHAIKDPETFAFDVPLDLEKRGALRDDADKPF